MFSNSRLFYFQGYRIYNKVSLPIIKCDIIAVYFLLQVVFISLMIKQRQAACLGIVILLALVTTAILIITHFKVYHKHQVYILATKIIIVLLLLWLGFSLCFCEDAIKFSLISLHFYDCKLPYYPHSSVPRDVSQAKQIKLSG